jgi:hypothetical protein
MFHCNKAGKSGYPFSVKQYDCGINEYEFVKVAWGYVPGNIFKNVK